MNDCKKNSDAVAYNPTDACTMLMLFRVMAVNFAMQVESLIHEVASTVDETNRVASEESDNAADDT